MAYAVFEQFVGNPGGATSPDIGVTAYFCVGGIIGQPQGEIGVPVVITPLDTPVTLKQKLSSAIKDAVQATHGVALGNNDIVLFDMTRGQII